jgi:hypothetical protein
MSRSTFAEAIRDYLLKNYGRDFYPGEKVILPTGGYFIIHSDREEALLTINRILEASK